MMNLNKHSEGFQYEILLEEKVEIHEPQAEKYEI